MSTQPLPVIEQMGRIESNAESILNELKTKSWKTTTFFQTIAFKVLAIVAVIHPSYHMTNTQQTWVMAGAGVAVMVEQVVYNIQHHKSLQAQLQTILNFSPRS